MLAMMYLAPLLTAKQLSEAISICKTIGSASFRALSLNEIASNALSDVSEVFLEILALKSLLHRSMVLRNVVPRLTIEHVNEALAFGCNNAKVEDRAELLGVLASRLSEEAWRSSRRSPRT
jgi:hypothetical protein